MNMQVNAQMGPVPGPDGRAWVGFVLASGALQVQLLLHPDEADAFADQIAAGVKQAAAQAKQANGGLILPPGAGKPLVVPVPQTPPTNGDGRPRGNGHQA